MGREGGRGAGRQADLGQADPEQMGGRGSRVGPEVVVGRREGGSRVRHKIAGKMWGSRVIP